MLHDLRLDARRAFLSPLFFICIAAVVLVSCWGISSEIRSATPEYGSVIYLYHYDFSLLLLVIAAVPYCTSFCSDFNNQFIRSHIIRTGFWSYSISKCIVCYLSAFLSYFIGAILFLLLLRTRYPVFLAFSDEQYLTLPMGYLLKEGHYWGYLLVKVISRAAYIGFFSVLALVTTTYITNVFVAVSSSIIWYYFLVNLFSVIRPPKMLYLYTLLNGNLDLGNTFLSVGYTIGLSLILTALLILLFKRKVKERMANG